MAELDVGSKKINLIDANQEREKMKFVTEKRPLLKEFEEKIFDFWEQELKGILF